MFYPENCSHSAANFSVFWQTPPLDPLTSPGDGDPTCHWRRGARSGRKSRGGRRGSPLGRWNRSSRWSLRGKPGSHLYNRREGELKEKYVCVNVNESSEVRLCLTMLSPWMTYFKQEILKIQNIHCQDIIPFIGLQKTNNLKQKHNSFLILAWWFY